MVARNKRPTLKILDTVKREFSKLDEREFQRRQEIRAALTKKGTRKFKKEMYEASLRPNFKWKEKDILVQAAQRIRGGNLERIIDEVILTKNLDKQTAIAERFGPKRIDDIDKELRNLAKRGKKEFEHARIQKSYIDLHREVYNSLEEITEEEKKFIGSDEQEYLLEFLQKVAEVAKKAGEKDITLERELIDTYLRKAREIYAREDEATFRAWHNSILDEASIDELISNLLEKNIHSAGATKKEIKSADLKERKEVLEKYCSIYAGRRIVLQSTEQLTYEFSLPVIQQKRVRLPSSVKIFTTEEENDQILQMLAILQAECMREGYLPEGQTSLQQHFEKYENPTIARRIWQTITYAEAQAAIQRKWPKLAEQIEEVQKKLREGYGTIITSPKFPSEVQQIIDALEKIVVLGIEPRSKAGSIAHGLQAHAKDIRRSKEGRVADIYEIINREIGIPPQQQSRQGEYKRKRRGTANLEERTRAEYTGQQIHFFEDVGQELRARVIVKQARGVENQRVRQVRQEQQAQISATQREFERLKPQRVTTEKRLYDGEIDEDALMQMLLELNAGGDPDTNIYKARRIKERDTAVLLSVDLSRGLGRWVTEDSRTIDYVRPAVIHLAEAAAKIGDPLAIIGHTSRSSEETFINMFKDFDEEHTAEVDHRLGLMGPLYETRAGTAYKWIAEHFTRTGAKRKIHIDLIAATKAPKDYPKEVAIADTTAAIRKERVAGIEPYAFCLDKEADQDELAKIYGTGRFIQVIHPERLAEEITRLYRKIAL